MFRKKNQSLNSNSLCVDLKKMKEAGSVAQFFACFIYMKMFQGQDRWIKGYEYAMDMISYAKEELATCSETVRLAISYDSLLKNEEEGKISAFLTIEEGGIIDGELEKLRELYQQGIRLITLTWNEENCIGFPNSLNATTMKAGLKPFGIEVVEQMNDMGMIIDVSHLSDGGFWDVLERSKQSVLASHSNARALCAHPRNLTDDMIRALAERGGVAGVNFYPYFVNPTGKASVEDLARHIEHMYQIGGEEFVAIGTDFDGFVDGELELKHIGQMEKLHDVLKKRGFSVRQIEKFWNGNVRRITKDIL